MATSFVAGGGIQSESISDFDPRTLGGCVLWLDAADRNTVFTDTAGTTLANNGDLVARWNDKANSGKFVLQSTSNLRPAYFRPSNSLPVVNFTGTNPGNQQSFDFSDVSTPPMPVGTNPATYFIVAKANVLSSSVSGNIVISYGTQGGTTNNERTIGLYGPPNNLARFSVGTSVSDVSTSATQTTIQSVVYSNFISSNSVNGNTPTIRDFQSLNPNTGTTAYRIGNYLTGDSPFYGYMSEILVFNRALQNDERQQVEGYLAWKWGLVSNLPTTHPYYYSKAPQTAFQPTNFPSCALWLDAADTNTVTRSVSQWTDKSGNNNHATQTTAANQPTYLNNRLSFNGTSNFLSLSNSTQLDFGTNDFSIFAMVRNNPATPTSIHNIIVKNNPARPQWRLALENNRNDITIFDNTTLQSSAVINPMISGWNLLNGVVNRSTGNTLFRNGINVATSPPIVGSLSNSSVVTIGSNTAGNDRFWNSDMAEIIVYTGVPTTAQRQQLEGYLAWKWGTQGTLPAGHPFASSPPSFTNPTSIPGCQLWLDAADSSSVVATNVTQWNDKSGNSFNATSSGNPTYSGITNGISLTSGAGFTYSGSTIIPGANPLGGYTLFSIFNTPSTFVTSGATRIFGLWDGSGNDFTGPNGLMALTINSSASVGGFISTQRGSAYPITTGTLNTNRRYIGTVISTSGGSFSVGINAATSGNLFASSSSSSGAYNNLTRYFIGRNSIDTEPLNGAIQEVLLFNATLTSVQVQQIEGYLAWKWGLQGDLPSTHPFTQANYFFNNTRPLTRYFNPPDIEGCQLWLDAADSTVVTRTNIGTTVTQWNDKSGNNRHFVAAGTSPTPTFSQSGFLGSPGLRFTRTSNTSRSVLQWTNSTTPLSTPDITVMMLVRRTASDTSNDRLLSTSSTINDNDFGLNNSFAFVNSRGGNSVIWRNNVSSVTSPSIIGIGATGSEIISMTINKSTLTSTIRQIVSGGIIIGTRTGTSGEPNVDLSLKHIRLGTSTGTATGVSDAASDTFQGVISEVIIYNSVLTTTQLENLEGYLAWKYNVVTSILPTSHPYRNTISPLTTPLSITGCQLWLDAADVTSIVTSNITSTVVTSIQDKSGLENNITNLGSTVRYISTLNSRSVLTFPSDGTILGNILTSPSLTRDANNFSAFYVCRYPTGTAHPIQALNFDLSTGISTTITGVPTPGGTTTFNVSSSTGFSIGRYVVISGVAPSVPPLTNTYNQTGLITAIPNSTSITVDLSINSNPGIYTSGGTITQLTSSHMFGHDGRSPNFNIQSVNYEAGTQSRAITSFGYTNPTLTGNTFVLGCVRQNGVFSLSTNGNTHTPVLTAFTSTGNKTSGAYSIFGGLQGLDIGEVVIYNTALTDNERQIIEGYLSWKWGIQRATAITNPSVSTSGTSLVYRSSHPYYNYPPIDVTPMTPALRLYKKTFDPSDLSPVIWIDPQDSSVVLRDTVSTNRITQIANKGSFVGNFTPPTGISGPLFTRSTVGNGAGVEFMDFSNGGHYQVTSATMEDATTMALTVFPPHNGNIPVGAFINLFATQGNYSDNSFATVNCGPFQIQTATISSLRTLTITTLTAHGISVNNSVRLTINTGSYLGGGDASGLTGTYTAQIGTTASTIVLTLSADQTNGIMAISDGHVRNNVGTTGPYITQTGTTGSIVKLTSYSSRSIGNLVNLLARIEYGSIPITSGEIGTSNVTLQSVSSSVFTASDVSGVVLGTPLIPDTTGGGLTAGTTYFITSLSGATFRLASSIGNALASTPVTLTFSDNASLNLAVKCYGTRVTFRTPIDHNIQSNQLININCNINFNLPFQTGMPTTDTPLMNSAIEFTSATISGTSPNQVLTINLSTVTGRQNPFFALVSGVPTYTSRGTFSVRLSTGTLFGDSTSTGDLLLTSLSTTSNSANNNSTSIEIALGTSGARPTGNLTFNGLPGVIYVTSGLGNNANQLNIAVTPITVIGNTIVTSTPNEYGSVAARTVAPNIGRLLTPSFRPSDTSDIRSSCILYPVNGYSLENSSLSNALDSSTTTVVFVTHLTNPVYRNGRFGSASQPTILSTATTVGGASGDNATSYRIGAASFAGNASRFVLRHSNAQSQNNSSSGFWTDTTNPFRINTAYLNLTQTSTGDCPAYSRGLSLGGYSYDTNFYNFSNQSGPTNITGGVPTGTLTTAHIRIGSRTDATSTYSGNNIPNTQWYEGGIGDILIFNRILPVEERRLLEGFLAQKYRTTGSVGGNAISLNTRNTPYAITGSGTITGSAPNFTITLNYASATAFIPGTQIIISGVTTATGLNGTWTVATSNATTVTFLSPTNTNMSWASGNGGTISGVTTATGNFIHPYRTNPTTITGSNTLGTPITSPNQISNNLAAWFDATYTPSLSTSTSSYTNTFIADNTGIAGWGSRGGSWSQSVNGAGWIGQTISTRQPAYITNSINGLPGLRFSGISGSESGLDNALNAGRLEYMAVTQDANPNTTIIAVIKPTSPTSSTILRVAQPGIADVRLNSGTDSKVVFSISNSTTTQSITSDALTLNQPYIIVARRMGTNMLIRTIGVSGTTNTSTESNLSIIGSTGAYLRIGNSFGTGTNPFIGDINEFMIFRSALTDQAVQQVEGYLAWKWGLQGSLPNSHAYKRISA